MIVELTNHKQGLVTTFRKWKYFKDQVEYFKTEGRYQETQQNLAMFAIKER